jgi:hypothetical protein
MSTSFAIQRFSRYPLVQGETAPPDFWNIGELMLKMGALVLTLNPLVPTSGAKV